MSDKRLGHCARVSRRPGEPLQIGESVRITVVDVQGNKVRLGIVAPREVPVDRLEIYERKRRLEENGNDGPPERG
jgi:carbon storage regulator